MVSWLTFTFHQWTFSKKASSHFLLNLAYSLKHSNGVKENVIRRLETIENCKIRGLGRDVNGIEATFMLALCGERRGRLLDERDLRKLEVANRLYNNKYEWVVESTGHSGGLAVQEVELQHGFLNRPHASETLVSNLLQLCEGVKTAYLNFQSHKYCIWRVLSLSSHGSIYERAFLAWKSSN